MSSRRAFSPRQIRLIRYVYQMSPGSEGFEGFSLKDPNARTLAWHDALPMPKPPCKDNQSLQQACKGHKHETLSFRAEKLFFCSKFACRYASRSLQITRSRPVMDRPRRCKISGTWIPNNIHTEITGSRTT